MRGKVILQSQGKEFITLYGKDFLHRPIITFFTFPVASFITGGVNGSTDFVYCKSTLMIYDRHPESQSKWDKAFWIRGYYVSTIGSITEDAIKKYIRE